MKKLSDILSAIFHPLLIPLFAFGLLFVFTYLNIMPIQYIAFVLSIVATFTLLAPLLFLVSSYHSCGQKKSAEFGIFHPPGGLAEKKKGE